jgi:hypothetical protein
MRTWSGGSDGRAVALTGWMPYNTPPLRGNPKFPPT